jgi:hypothetical protein
MFFEEGVSRWALIMRRVGIDRDHPVDLMPNLPSDETAQIV